MRLNKSLKTLLLALIIVGSLEIFGKNIVEWYYNTFSQTICTENFCIKKPRNWLPVMVKNNNERYFLNLINTKYIFWDIPKNLYIKKYKNGIILEKDNNFIYIYGTHNKIKNHREMNGKSYVVHREKSLGFVIYPKKNICIIMDPYKEKIIKYILSYEENKHSDI